MIKVNIAPQYWCSTLSTIEIPDVKSWADIKEWYVKWETLHYTVDGENWKEIDLGVGGCDSLVDMVDIKRPIHVRIMDPETGKTLEDSDD